MIWDILLVLSVLINVFLMVYVRWLIQGLREQSKQIETNNEVVIDFVEHVNSLHEMEMYYGDQTLQELIRHGKSVVEYFESLDFLIEEEGEEEQDADR